jgi:transposase
MMKALIVGVDIHRKTNTFCLMDQAGVEQRPRFTLDNNRPGTRQFIEQVSEVMQNEEFPELRLAAEATGWYWFHFFQTLQQDELLQAWPVELFALNPRRTANFQKSYVDLDKSDPIDAFVIADRLRWGRDIPKPFSYEEAYLALRFLTRYRYHEVHNRAREKAYCTATLYLKASEYSREDRKAFADLFGATSRAVLQEFASIEEVAALPFDELVEFIDRLGKRRFPDPADNAHKLQRLAQRSYHLPEALQQPINLILSLSLNHITALEKQQKRVDDAIAEAIQPIPHTLDTLPGFGPVLSAGIMAEIGHAERFDYDQDKVACEALLRRSPVSSGVTPALLTSRPKKPLSLAPLTPICVTISAKLPSRFRGVTQNIPLSTRKSMTKPANIATSEPWSSPLASWSVWLFIYW